MFLEVRNFAATNLAQGREMDDSYMRDYLVNLLPWNYILGERLGWLGYIDDLKFDTEGKQIAAEYFPPNVPQGRNVGGIEVYRQRQAGNVSRHRFWHDIFHEIGHTTYEGLSRRFRFQTAWLKVWEGSPSVFTAMKAMNTITSDQEEFAQTYALYVQTGWNLKEENPMRYAFMKNNVFIGREYEPESV